MKCSSLFLSLFFTAALPALAQHAANPTTFLEKLTEQLKAGQNQAALNFLQKEVPAEARESHQFSFMEGFLLKTLGKPTDAEKKLQSVAEAKVGLSAYASFFLGQMAIEAGDNSKAEKNFLMTEALKPQQKLWNENAFQLIQIDVTSKRWTEMKKRLSQLEQNLRREPEYPKVLWLRAQADQGLGQKAQVCNSLRKLYSQHPQFSAIAHWGHDLSQNEFLGQKTECTADLDDFRQRIRLLIFHGEVEEAEKELLARKTIMLQNSPFEAEFMHAQFLIQRGEAPKALALLKPFVNQRKSDEKFRNVLASALARSGEHPAAVGIYDALAKEHGKGRMGLEYSYRAGVLCYQTQDYDCAVKRFTQIVKKNGSSRQGLESRWHLAWIAYLKSRFPQALTELEKVPLGKKGRNLTQFQKRVVFWRGVTKLKLKKIKPAQEDFKRLIEEDANGFYGLAARSRMLQLSNIDMKTAATTTTQVAAEEVKAAEALEPSNSVEKLLDKGELANQEWEESEVPIAGNEGGALEQGEVGADGITIKASDKSGDGVLESKILDVKVLASLGKEEWARWELYDIEKSLPRKSPLRRRLVKEYQALEMYHRSSLLAQNQWSGKLDSKLAEDRELAEAAYPLAYHPSVTKYSNLYQVPGEFILSIMRAESSYRAQAVSPVGALGLMQVMPMTGKRIAEMLKESPYEPKQLLAPDQAIRFGARYLQRLLRSFNQNMVLASAAYNAGPHRVKQWLSQFGELEVDEFIEHIPYIETRNYVKKVLAFTLTYRTLYKDKFDSKSDPIPNLSATINFRFEGTPPVRETWEEI